MKKILSIILALALTFSLASCSVGDNKGGSNDGTNDNVKENAKTEIFEDLSTVTFTLPKMGEEPVDTELTDEQKEQGFISVEVNDDGSTTYTMRKTAWREYLEEMRTTGLDFLLNTSEDGYESIYSYEINEDLDTATIYVDYDKYNSGGDSFAILSVHLTMTLIQYIKGATEDTVAYTVEIADYQTKEVIDTIEMPQE